MNVYQEIKPNLLPFSARGLLGFESQQLSYRLPVKVDVLRANLVALNLNEGSPWIGDGATGRRGAVHPAAIGPPRQKKGCPCRRRPTKKFLANSGEGEALRNS